MHVILFGFIAFIFTNIVHKHAIMMKVIKTYTSYQSMGDATCHIFYLSNERLSDTFFRILIGSVSNRMQFLISFERY